MRKVDPPRVVSPEASRFQELQLELQRKDRLLLEQTVLLSLARRERSARGGQGLFRRREERETLLARVREAHVAGARLAAICELLGVSPRSIQRWRKQTSLEDRRAERRVPPANRLSDEERRQLLHVMNAQVDRPFTLRHLVAKLADEGVYLASESTMYRLRRSQGSSTPPVHLPPAGSALFQSHVADRPNRVWSWDISQLKGYTRGVKFYLYLVMDVFSRRIMGWHVDSRESADIATRFICKAYHETPGGRPRGLQLHSDNGGPMRAARLQTTLRELGMRASFSRPGRCSDNALAEALFRTLKSRPSYPRVFTCLRQARRWMVDFVRWYNSEHPHSGISCVTPDARHAGREQELLANRNRVFALARRAHPERWSGPPRVWSPAGPGSVRATPRTPTDSATAQKQDGDNPLDTHPPPTPPPGGSLVVALTT